MLLHLKNKPVQDYGVFAGFGAFAVGVLTMMAGWLYLELVVHVAPRYCSERTKHNGA